MKVLMLGWELPPHNSGGLGVACYQLCRALANNGADIEFILPYNAPHEINFMRIRATSPQAAVELSAGGDAYASHRYIRYQDGHEGWLDLFGQVEMYTHAVERLVEELEFDIIHAHDWLTFRAALRVREHSGCPVVLHVHALERDRAGGAGKGNPLVREVEDLALNLADHIVAISQYTKEGIVSEYGVSPDRIQVIHNSMDVSATIPLDNVNSYRYLTAMKRRGYKVVVNVGRKTLQKGLPNLLRAAQAVVERAPKTFFMLSGPGEQYHELVELAADLGISKNVFLIDSFLPNRQHWRDAFAIGDLFVMPSISEPFGLTALEAVGYGTPVLITKQSGVAEVLRSALKVDFWDVDEMANQIVSVLQNPPLAQELLTQAQREYSQLSWEPAAEQLIDLYNKHTAGAPA